MRLLVPALATLIPLGTLVPATAQNQPTDAFIYGKVFTLDRQRAKNIGVTAEPLGVLLGTVLPHTKTNEAGEYRLPAPWWGRYTVCAEDEDAGYAPFATGCAGPYAPQVEITPERKVAELNITLPPKAGFLEIHLSNRKTGAKILTMSVKFMAAEKPKVVVYSISCYSNKVILVPPNKDLLLHITSSGFREWDETAGGGKPIRLTSGQRLKIDVQLEPN